MLAGTNNDHFIGPEIEVVAGTGDKSNRDALQHLQTKPVPVR